MRNAVKTIKELDRLRNLIQKYSHRWGGENTSERLRGWVLDYDSLRGETRTQDWHLWEVYCEARGYTTCHDAGDLLA